MKNHSPMLSRTHPLSGDFFTESGSPAFWCPHPPPGHVSMTELLTAPHISVPTPGLWNTSPPAWKTVRRRQWPTEPAKPRMHFCFTLYHNPVRSGIRGHGSTQREFTCRGQAAPMLKFSTGILKLLLFILTALGNSVASPENTHSFWYHGAIFLGKLPLPEYQSNLEELMSKCLDRVRTMVCLLLTSFPFKELLEIDLCKLPVPFSPVISFYLWLLFHLKNS